ncbi:hypothetical protein PP631_gp050 [Streptomyces phage KimJongPhill]|uniref:Uncharacterized protein n=1 Tax=Streptomyces phage KimJongPhill TaxID=2848886 RepID=A0A8F2E6D3_9CAUD|nr:hypothetical protein PP631_gp050 [Streptomyces phage KimJongPhill]QWT29831.1 hypothetical protein SEA_KIMJONGPHILL_50 [Streptomyces phage KimJongPhill]
MATDPMEVPTEDNEDSPCIGEETTPEVIVVQGSTDDDA